MKNIFAGADDKKCLEGQGGNYFPAGGNFLLEVTRIKLIDPPGKCPMLVCEFEVLETDHDDCVVGGKYAWVLPSWSATAKTDRYFHAGVREFFAALLNCSPQGDPPEGRWSDVALEAANEDSSQGEVNPCAGQKIRLTTQAKPKKAGGTFTVHLWKSVVK